eukprot:4524497-Ditylum_brightwellii.AAC.1
MQIKHKEEKDALISANAELDLVCAALKDQIKGLEQLLEDGKLLHEKTLQGMETAQTVDMASHKEEEERLNTTLKNVKEERRSLEENVEQMNMASKDLKKK